MPLNDKYLSIHDTFASLPTPILAKIMSRPDQTALAIPELFEQVLLQLDMRTLLTSAQRVCRRWREAILLSPLLQEKLFFRPAADTAGPRVRNPLLCELFPHFFPAEGAEKLRKFSKDELEDELPIGREDCNALFMYKGASWRRMFPTQPPFYSLVRAIFSEGRSKVFLISLITQHDGTGEAEMRSWEGYCKNKPAEGTRAGGKPMQMDAFYDQLTWEGEGVAHDWMFIWRHPVSQTQIPSSLDDMLSYKEIKGGFAEEIQQGLDRDGVVIFAWETPQCSSNVRPWIFKAKFRFPMEVDSPYTTFCKTLGCYYNEREGYTHDGEHE